MDQSRNAVTFLRNINIIKSCLSAPEHQQLQLFLLGIHYCHLNTHSTIFTVLAKMDGGYLFYTEPSTMVQKISHILTVLSVDDKTSDRLSYLT